MLVHIAVDFFGQLAYDCYIENCYNTGNINYKTNSSFVGGVCGNINIRSKAKKCYNTGNIGQDCSETSHTIGGVCGNLSDVGNLTQCFNTGNIMGYNRIGGIIGRANIDIKIENCYNTGNIEGIDKVGGLIGQSRKIQVINNCYNSSIIKGDTNIGGVVGALILEENESNPVNNTFSNEENNRFFGFCSKNFTVDNKYIISANELKSATSKLGNNYKEDTQNINNGYPILLWQ